MSKKCNILQADTFALNPTHPLFTCAQFLEIMKHVHSNLYRVLHESNSTSVFALFEKLQPFTTIAFVSEQDVYYFLAQLDNLFCTEPFSLTQMLVDIVARNKADFSMEQLRKIPPQLQNAIEATASPLRQRFTSLYKVHQFCLFHDPIEFEGREALEIAIQSLSMYKIEYQEGTYFGHVNEQRLPHGEGTWVSTDQTCKYIGLWHNGKKSGDGHYISSELVYEGEWNDDVYHGDGKLVYKSGPFKSYRYEGEFLNGLRHGVGTQYYHGTDLQLADEHGEPCEAWYRGTWSKDKFHGNGEYRSSKKWQLGKFNASRIMHGIGQEIGQDENNNTCYFAQEFNNYKLISNTSMLPESFLKTLNEPQEVIPFHKAPKRTFWRYYLFRSRLEARWALFFDFLGIDYLYEPKTFDMPDKTSYTPDFYLPMMNMWFEM